MPGRLVLILLALALCQCGDPDWLSYTPMDFLGAPTPYADAQAPVRLKAASVSMSVDRTDVRKNLEKMRDMAERIKQAHGDVQVIVFMELSLGWLVDPEQGRAYQESVAQPIPGPATGFLKEVATRLDTALVFGMAERDGEELYNSQVLIQRDGTLVKYRKRNLNEADRASGFRSGTEPVTVEVDGVRCALLVCSDMQSERIAREVGRSDAQVLLMSLTTLEDMGGVHYLGREFNKWVVFANRSGLEGDTQYRGFIYVIDPAGNARAFAEGESTDQYVFHDMGIY